MEMFLFRDCFFSFPFALSTDEVCMGESSCQPGVHCRLNVWEEMFDQQCQILGYLSEKLTLVILFCFDCKHGQGAFGAPLGS